MRPSREGAVPLLLPESPTTRGPARRRPIFYNAAMALDRDLTVAIVRAAADGRTDLVGWEPFAATGVRGLRLLAETGAFARFLLSDRGREATAVLRENVREPAAAGARVVRANAARPPTRAVFDYIDLDPFGTPAPYLAVGVDRLRPGGLLGVTATDLPVLTGVARGVALERYGGRPVRGRLGPEGGLRLLLARIATTARAHGRSMHPVAAYVQDHHLRVVARLGPSSSPADPIGPIDPATFPGPVLPPGGPYGPMWTGALFDPTVIARLEPPTHAARPRECRRWIDRFQGEAGLIAPFYYEPNELARELHLASPPRPDDLVRRLRERGFAAARTHVREGAVRTAATHDVVLGIAGAPA